ncbi:MAG: FmdB family transcriptional regulator [Lentisphaerae bacterium GWF2_52_8]|nr:MAG: FmdB family transcriptional regulator [Lentisphaerae bacterium GWF2_52_8]
MPTYDYKCTSCGHELEVFQSIKADPLTECPACKKKKLRRLFGTGAGIIFKGSGFYCTDYRSENYRKSQANDKAPSAASTSGAGETAKA